MLLYRQLSLFILFLLVNINLVACGPTKSAAAAPILAAGASKVGGPAPAALPAAQPQDHGEQGSDYTVEETVIHYDDSVQSRGGSGQDYSDDGLGSLEAAGSDYADEAYGADYADEEDIGSDYQLSAEVNGEDYTVFYGGGGNDYQAVKKVSKVKSVAPLESAHKLDGPPVQLKQVQPIKGAPLPLRSVKELSSMQELAELQPVEELEEVVGIQEIKSMEPIPDEVAMKFIRDKGLKPLGPGQLGGGGASKRLHYGGKGKNVPQGGGDIPVVAGDEAAVAPKRPHRPPAADVSHASRSSSAGGHAKGLQRILDLFGIKSLDQITDVIPIQSIQEVDDKLGAINHKSGGGKSATKSDHHAPAISSDEDALLFSDELEDNRRRHKSPSVSMDEAPLVSSDEDYRRPKPPSVSLDEAPLVSADEDYRLIPRWALDEVEDYGRNGQKHGKRPDVPLSSLDENTAIGGGGKLTDTLSPIQESLAREEKAADLLSTALARQGAKIKAMQKVKQIHDIKRLEAIKRLEEVKKILEVSGLHEVKSLQKVKSIQPVVSMTEVKGIWPLSSAEAVELKAASRKHNAGKQLA